MTPLTEWTNFYVIIGTSAGALTGLTFVVITVVTSIQVRNTNDGVNAFTTPTVVHFGVVLFISGIIAAPWRNLGLPALALGLCGLGGLGYSGIVIRRIRRMAVQGAYTPFRDDWLWYAIFPAAACMLLVIAAVLLLGNPEVALFGVGAVSLLLLFIGIRNAWDVVTYVTLEFLQRREANGDASRE